MKKTTGLLLASTLVLSGIGCDKKNSKANSTDKAVAQGKIAPKQTVTKEQYDTDFAAFQASEKRLSTVGLTLVKTVTPENKAVVYVWSNSLITGLKGQNVKDFLKFNADADENTRKLREQGLEQYIKAGNNILKTYAKGAKVIVNGAEQEFSRNEATMTDIKLKMDKAQETLQLLKDHQKIQPK